MRVLAVSLVGLIYFYYLYPTDDVLGGYSRTKPTRGPLYAITPKNMNRLLLLFIILIAAFACTKDEIDVKKVEPSASWKEDPRFTNLSKIIINSFTTEEKLLLYGPMLFASISKDNQIVRYALWFSYPEYFRLPISSQYFVKTHEEYVYFTSSDYPVTDYYGRLNLKELEPTFKKIDFGSLYQTGAISINDVGQCLIPLQTTNPNNIIVTYIFNISVQNEYFVKITDTTKIILENPSPDPYPGVYFTKAIGNDFIVAAHGATFKVYQNGTSKLVLNNSLQNIFSHAGKLYGFKQFEKLYISEDNGESWVLNNHFPDSFVIANYFSIGDSVVASINSDIFTINLSKDRIKINDLNNEGLEGNEITSISEFNDSIYVSTYSGVFLKNKADFFKYKQKE
jgi:hypothetical protein